jgi:hypothetical protein
MLPNRLGEAGVFGGVFNNGEIVNIAIIASEKWEF